MEIEIRPGTISRGENSAVKCIPLFSRIISLCAEQNELQEQFELYKLHVLHELYDVLYELYELHEEHDLNELHEQYDACAPRRVSIGRRL